MTALLLVFFGLAAHAQGEPASEVTATDALESSPAEVPEETLTTASAPVELTWDTVEIRRRVDVHFPLREFKQSGLTEVSCQVQFSNDERGRPYQITVSDCDEIFHANIEKTAMQWRFKPVEHDGERVETVFSIRLKFKKS